MHDTLLMDDWIDIRQAEFGDEDDTQPMSPLTEPLVTVTIPQSLYLKLLKMERTARSEVE